MRPLTAFLNREMEQLVDALHGSSIACVWEVVWSLSRSNLRRKRWFSVFSGCTKTCLIAVAFLTGTTLSA